MSKPSLSYCNNYIYFKLNANNTIKIETTLHLPVFNENNVRYTQHRIKNGGTDISYNFK